MKLANYKHIAKHMTKLMTLTMGLLLNLTLVIDQGLAQTSTTVASTTDISILPLAGPNMNDVVVDSQMSLTRSMNDTTYMDINVYCYGTNLRGVSNPLSPAAQIIAQIEYQAADYSYKFYTLTFPADMVSKDKSYDQDITPTSIASNDADGVSGVTKFTAHIRDSVIRVAMKRTRAIGLDLLSSTDDFGKLTNLDDKTNLIKTIRFQQKMPPGTTQQQFMGWDGPLTASVRWYASENGKQIKVYAGFPGENRYCGGYFSPLVLKFKSPEKVPGLSKTSHFSLYTKELKLPGGPRKISWPDFNEETYFLAMDINGNGKIDNGSELFGDINGYENGFANLANYDESKDGVIDEKDKIFSKLLLWKDSDHDGVSHKKEIKKIQALGVSSISLTYEKGLREIGRSGKVLGPGEFTYKDKKGSITKGSVWDVFLVSAP